MKTCPFCANEIQDAAIKCQFCHSMVEPAAPPPKLERAPAVSSIQDAAVVHTAAMAAGTGAAGATVQEPPPRIRRRAARPARHPVLQFLIIVGVIYFIAAAGFDLFKGRVVGAGANLVGAIPFALSAPVLWWLGDAFRNFAMPSMYFGSGAIDMAKQRLFWMLGPQTIGVLIAFALFAAFGAVAGEIPMPFSQPQTAASPPSDATDSAAPASAAQAEIESAAPPAAAPAAVAAESEGRFSADGQSAGSITDLPPTETLLFEAHKVDVYTGPVTQPDFSDMGALAGYVPKLKAAIAAGPNFAGSYVLTTIPCGVACTAGVAIDLTQGDAISLPRGGPQEPHLAMEFVKDSSLIRMRWAAQSDAAGHVTSCGHEDFVLTDNGFESQGKGVEPGPCPT